MFGLSLFIAAGALDWTIAWLYLIIVIASMIIERHVLHPELLTKQSMRKDGTKKWDLVTAPFVNVVGPLAVCITAGLDQRFGWSTVFPQIRVIAFIIMIFGFFLVLWAMKANAFYSETVRIHYERYHVVITDGPYRYIRHPGYAGNSLVSLAIPLVLGSWFALMPSVFVIFGHVIRTFLEDVTLQRQFKGYYDYTKKVSFRIFPGVW